jgi:hypothetical protein
MQRQMPSGVSPFQPEAPIMTSIESFLIEIDLIPGSQMSASRLSLTAKRCE